MCEPTTIAMLAISVIGAGVSMAAQQKQNKAITEQANSTNNALSLQQQQVNQQSSQEQTNRSKQAAIEQGAMRAAASENNFIGNSTSSIFKESMFNEGTDLASMEQNRVNKNEQIQREKEATSKKAKGQQVSSGAMMASAGLQIGGAALGSYNQSAATKATAANKKT